ncbi:hypothetical protein HMI56_005112 [Coelomomyces lativittatus]|nr:hypothetical protein HMI56_005112 [Coelomomyces lativittatus]
MGKTSHPPLTERDFDRRPPYPVTLIGPKGSFTSYLKPCVQLHFRPCPLPTLPTLPTSSSIPMKMHMHVTVDHPDLKRQRTIWGTTRSLLANMMVGITQGWTWYVKVVGVGYRVSVIELPSPPSPSSTFPQEEEEEKEEKEKESSMGGSVPPRTVVVQLDVGYAHPIHVPVPVALHVQDQLTVEALSVDTLRIMGMDKMKVAQLAATLRKHRPPEPYHLKGIFVNNETIQKKKSKKR